MREIVLHVVIDRPGHLEARAELLPIAISAPSLEELQHEAREVLIAHSGAAHGAYRVRVQRPLRSSGAVQPSHTPGGRHICC
ncbi:MAG: hypothetical protein VKM34_00260 [Cyanobacteriota bacterium]|nr:hypothetical protein [Cyanobacteriota bacterium]